MTSLLRWSTDTPRGQLAASLKALKSDVREVIGSMVPSNFLAVKVPDAKPVHRRSLRRGERRSAYAAIVAANAIKGADSCPPVQQAGAGDDVEDWAEVVRAVAACRAGQAARSLLDLSRPDLDFTALDAGMGPGQSCPDHSRVHRSAPPSPGRAWPHLIEAIVPPAV